MATVQANCALKLCTFLTRTVSFLAEGVLDFPPHKLENGLSLQSTAVVQQMKGPDLIGHDQNPPTFYLLFYPTNNILIINILILLKPLFQIALHCPRLRFSLWLPKRKSCPSILAPVFALGLSFPKNSARRPNKHKYIQYDLFINVGVQDAPLHILKSHFFKTNNVFITLYFVGICFVVFSLILPSLYRQSVCTADEKAGIR